MKVLGNPQWATDERFADLEQRLRHQDELDELVDLETAKWERYELMNALQAAGVPAGVAQNAEDRVDSDPQLRHQQWLVDLQQSENGVWPVKQLPVQMSQTPAHVGGVKQRNGPNYGEDTADVLTRLLGFSEAEVQGLYDEGVV